MSRARITELEAERDEYRTTCLQLDAERNKERTRAEQAEAEVARLKKLARKLARWLPIDGSTYDIYGVPKELLHDKMAPEDWLLAARYEAEHK